MQLHELHTKLYDGMPEGTVINICELAENDARLVSNNVLAVAQAHNLDSVALEAAAEGDAWYVNQELSKRFQALIAEYGVEAY